MISPLTLHGCIDCTDWDMFKESCADIDELTDVVSSRDSYCEYIVPDKVVKVYPNSKPWVSKSLIVLLNCKRKSFKDGNLT